MVVVVVVIVVMIVATAATAWWWRRCCSRVVWVTPYRSPVKAHLPFIALSHHWLGIIYSVTQCPPNLQFSFPAIGHRFCYKTVLPGERHKHNGKTRTVFVVVMVMVVVVVVAATSIVVVVE